VKQIEILRALEALGWKCRKDEVGDSFCRQDIGDLQIQIIPSAGKRDGYFRVSFMTSVSTNKFSTAVAYIYGEAMEYAPIVASNNVPEKIANLSHDEIDRLSQNAISWASAQNIEKGLAAYRVLPTDSKGAKPIHRT
jgi:hypothetical protein